MDACGYATLHAVESEILTLPTAKAGGFSVREIPPVPSGRRGGAAARVGGLSGRVRDRVVLAAQQERRLVVVVAPRALAVLRGAGDQPPPFLAPIAPLLPAPAPPLGS